MSIETMGGYRLVRKLGEGERSEVFLGYPAREAADAAPAAIKIYRPWVSGDSIMTEIEVLTRAAGPHCVQLTDLASSPQGGFALVLERVTGGSLARLVGERSSLRVGEAITILGPLASTVMRIHEAGVAHANLSAERVLFTAQGAPVLVGFGASRLIPPALPVATLGAHEDVRDDYTAFSRLARSVLTLVRDERAHELAAWLAEESYPDGWIESVSRRIYGLGDASAVDLEGVLGDPARALPARAVRSSAPVEQSRSRVLDLVGAPDWVQDVLRAPLARLTPIVRTVRPRVWITAAAVAVGLVCAVVLVPSSDSDATAEQPVATATASSPAPTGDVAGDDPVAALLVLWEERQRCIRDMSVLCLDAVDQANSSALAADQQLVRSIQAGEELDALTRLTADRLSVSESLGDTAIVVIDSATDSEPASILMMRSEAGWRIRDYLE